MILFTVVGFQYRNESPNCMKNYKIIELKTEPTNKFDPNAIQVIVDGKHVAYVSRNDCNMVKYFLNKNYTVKVESIYNQSVKCILFCAEMERTKNMHSVNAEEYFRSTVFDDVDAEMEAYSLAQCQKDD